MSEKFSKERIEEEKTRVNAFGKVEPYYLDALSEIERLQSREQKLRELVGELKDTVEFYARHVGTDESALISRAEEILK